MPSKLKYVMQFSPTEYINVRTNQGLMSDLSRLKDTSKEYFAMTSIVPVDFIKALDILKNPPTVAIQGNNFSAIRWGIGQAQFNLSKDEGTRRKVYTQLMHEDHFSFSWELQRISVEAYAIFRYYAPQIISFITF